MTKYSARLILVSILVFTALLFAATLREGHNWGDDFALYLHHARNLAESKAYTDVGLIDNPYIFPDLGPPFYPPGFPALLAPAVKLFGLNFTALKIEVILSFVCALLFCYFLFEDRLPYPWLLATIAAIGLNPAFWRRSNDILSDFPFLMATYGALWLIHGAYRRTKGDPPLWMGALFGLCIYLAYAIRPHGLALAVAFAAYELLQSRKIRGILAITALTTAAGMLAQMAILGRDTRLRLFDLRPSWLVTSSIDHLKNYRAWWLTGYAPALSYALFLAVLGITVYGVWRSVRSGVRVYDVFAVFYMMIVIPYFLTDERYLMPIVPVLMLYLAIGLHDLTKRAAGNVRRIIPAACAAAVVFSYGTMYLKADRSPIREGAFDPEFVALCQYLQDNTSADSRILFRKPRLLTLLTGRTAGIYHDTPDREHLWGFMRANSVSHVVAGDAPHPDFDLDRTYLRPFVAAYPGRLTSIYRNRHFEVFRVAEPGK